MRQGIGYARDLGIAILEHGTVYGHVGVFHFPGGPDGRHRDTLEEKKAEFLTHTAVDSVDAAGELTTFHLEFERGTRYVMVTAMLREPVSAEDRAAAYGMISSIELGPRAAN